MEKVFGILLLVLFVCTSCGDKSEPSFKVYDEYSKEKKVEKKNNIGKATYIFWINKTEAKKLRGLTFNIKCKVTINEDGSIKILGYEKEQPYTVTKSLKKYLKTFRAGVKSLQSVEGRFSQGRFSPVPSTIRPLAVSRYP